MVESKSGQGPTGTGTGLATHLQLKDDAPGEMPNSGVGETKPVVGITPMLEGSGPGPEGGLRSNTGGGSGNSDTTKTRGQTEALAIDPTVAEGMTFDTTTKQAKAYRGFDKVARF